MFKLFSRFRKKASAKPVERLIEELYTAADLKQLDSDIEQTNVKIRKLYATSKLAIMNEDMNTVRIAARIRNNLLNRVENLRTQKTRLS